MRIEHSRNATHTAPKRLAAFSGFILLAAISALAPAQQPRATGQTAATRVVGSVAAISGRSLTVKPDSGPAITFAVADGARILETQPGAKTLAGATPIDLSEIAVGDRVLAVLRPAQDGAANAATTIVAMKKTAIAEHQQTEQADWQRRGVRGLVKTVDPASGTVTIASGSRTLTIHATPSTIVRRYNPDSIKFADARPSTLAQIQPGDQLRARGNRTGIDVTADEIVAGTFRNIAGTVISTDPQSNTVIVRDLATKAPITIHIAPDSQMHKLPEEMAQMIAFRLKRTSSTHQGEHPQRENERVAAPHSSWRQQNGAFGQRTADLSQMLQRTPPVTLSELHKGDAVMIVATQGTPGSATAVTLVAGVEPILTASPSGSQSMFSASWNVGGGPGVGTGDEGAP